MAITSSNDRSLTVSNISYRYCPTPKNETNVGCIIKKKEKKIDRFSVTEYSQNGKGWIYNISSQALGLLLYRRANKQID